MVYLKTLILWEKIDASHIYFDQDNGQSKVEISCQHSMCWIKQHPTLYEHTMNSHIYNNIQLMSCVYGPNNRFENKDFTGCHDPIVSY